MPEPHTQPVPAGVSPDRLLRAADHDRDAVAEMLREQHLAGRIDTEELQDRIGRCYAARTYGDLDAVLADLPAEIAPPRESRPARGAWGPPRLGVLPLPALAPLLFVAIALSHGHLVWLMLPFVFWFVSRRWRWRSAM